MGIIPNGARFRGSWTEGHGITNAQLLLQRSAHIHAWRALVITAIFITSQGLIICKTKTLNYNSY